MASDDRAAQEKPKRARVRSGCVRCRTKRRKCDELKPVCSRCREKKETCQWGARIVFREENNLSLNTLQLSLKHKKRTKSSSDQFEIQDITAKVIRDQQQQDTVESSLPSNDSAFMTRNRTSQMADEAVKLSNDIHTWGVATGMDTMPVLAPESTKIDDTYQQSLDLAVTDTLTALPVDDLSYVWPSPTSLGIYDDSIFLPGSAYLDAHSTLRSHLIHEVNATSVTRSGTPELHQEHRIDLSVCVGASLEDTSSERTSLTTEEEFVLMKNWIQEIAPWLDKFDSQRHFQHTLPIMARSHAHLRYSILATSARQIERKERSTHTERSLALYQKAIQLVLPELHTRSTPVIASCVVLCVLEMQSSSPKAWRQHLDGCAYLIQASGIHGFSGGINQALFWCFERMDVCGGLITSMNTLIPIEHWAPGATLEAHSEFFRNASGFDAHACYAVYLCGRVLDLFTHQTQLASRVRASTAGNPDLLSSSHIARWTELWNQIDAWQRHRPDEMLPISSVDTQTLPFPQILYSNPAAISGNQLYHTASILMLQHKPPNTILSPKPRSIFWHARQICAISISNHHHGAWTNSIQPIWIAGQWMSHPSEQKAILELLERIERETGWGTKWRAEDLKEFWGN